VEPDWLAGENIRADPKMLAVLTGEMPEDNPTTSETGFGFGSTSQITT
jgi:hypothetical protein